MDIQYHIKEKEDYFLYFSCYLCEKLDNLEKVLENTNRIEHNDLKDILLVKDTWEKLLKDRINA